ncbi:MAG: PAS domain S-box protein [Anaerolineales bacterium]|nr:PAS domain S-box protein [Anaerolineales bacterium]
MEQPFVLIVDAEQDIQNILTNQLQTVGYKTDVVETGEAVLPYCHHALPDLILLSLTLPDVDGLAICTQLHQDAATSYIPIICMAASTDPDLEVQALFAGAVEYLVKPVDLEKIDVRIRPYLFLFKERRQFARTIVVSEDARPLNLVQSLTNTPDYHAHLLNSLHDQVMVFDRNYQVVEVNEPLLQQTGRRREEVLGMRCYQVNHNLDALCWLHETHPCPALRVWETKRPHRATHTHYNKDGTASFVEVVCTPLLNDEGDMVGAIEACRDLTYEQHLEQRLSAVYQLSQELTLLQQETAVINRVLKTASDLLGGKTVTYGKVDESNRQLVHAGVYYSSKQEFTVLNTRLALDGDIGICVAVYQSGQPLRIPDLRQEPHYICVDQSYVSALCVPVQTQNRVVGILTTVSEKVDAFSEDDQQLLQTLADYAAIAIENARLHEQTQQELVERKRAELALIASEEKYRNYLDNAPDAIFVVDDLGHCLEVNHAACEMTGYTEQELTTLSIFQLLAPKELSQGQEYLQTLQETGRASSEVLCVRRDGGLYYLALDGVEIGEARHSIFARDVTERRHTEMALAQSEERYRSLVAAMAEGVVLHGADGRIIAANRRAEKILGLSRNQLLGRESADPRWHVIREDGTPFPSEEHPAMVTLRTGQPQENVIMGVYKPDDMLSWISINSEPIFQGNQSKPHGVAVSFSDITVAKQLDELLHYIAEQGWHLDGVAFFESLAQCLVKLLHVEQVEVGEIQADEGLWRALVVLRNGRLQPTYTLPQAETPFADIFQDALGRKPTTAYPSLYTDQRKTAEGLGSFAAIPLWGSTGEPLGALSVHDTSPFADPNLLESALQMVAVRAAHELERRQTEARLRQLSAAVEQSPATVVITDTQGNIEYVNPKFTEITGYTATEVRGKNPRLLKSGHTSPEEYRKLWEAITQGKEWRGEFLNTKKDGSLYWEFASISPIFNEEQEITHFVAVKEDITERKEVRENLRLRNEELQTLYRIGQMLNSSLNLSQVLQQLMGEVQQLFDVDACLVWMLDAETNELICEAVTEPIDAQMQGWRLLPGEGLVGWVVQHGRSLIVNDVTQDERHFPHIDPQVHAQLNSVLSVPFRVQQEIIGVFQAVDHNRDRFTLRDQRFAESLATVSGHAIENARLHTHLQNQLDLLKTTRARLVRSEKLAAVGELVAGVAHELNNPLAATILHAQLLQMRGIPEEFQKDLQQIVTQTRRASKVVQGLLDFARQRPPERSAMHINKLLHNTLELLNYELYTHNIRLVTQFADDMPVILADQYQLQQVFVNLIHNAQQAMTRAHGRGNLSVFTAVGPSHFVADELHPRQVVRVVIQDDGHGIPPQMQVRIFDPFFTTKEPGEGTGLGLSVCHGIIAEHDGHIWVESELEQGASFIVELPVTQSHVESNGDREQRTAVPHIPNTVELLLIDDEESVLNIVRRILQRQGYQVQISRTAEEALARLQQKSYDLILCDLRMPGMSGQELYEHLDRTQPHQAKRFILLTGDSISSQTRQFLEKSHLPYIHKPFDIGELVKLVQEQLAKVVS